MGIWIASMLMLYASMFDSHQEQATELQKRGSVAGSVVESTSDEPVRKALVILRGSNGATIGTNTRIQHSAGRLCSLRGLLG